jgi:glycolate oxidase iron-sulfur subunit
MDRVLERSTGPRDEDLQTCIHCGMCLEACPTYRITGLETESPRGRIHLMQAVFGGRVDAAPEVSVHFDRCLACRACEAVCPAGVPYGRLIEATRAFLAGRERPPLPRLLRWFAFRWLLPHPGRIEALAAIASVYERSGAKALLRRSGLIRLLPRRLRLLEGLLPPLTGPRFSRARGGVIAARGAPRSRVALLTGCVMRVAYGEVHEATARLLSRCGVEVIVPPEQVCCGALHVHSGERPDAVALARRNIAAFERTGADAIVVNAAGCGAHLKSYGELLEDDPTWAARAAAFSAKVRDLSEILVELIADIRLGPVPLRVTYQDPCHLAHAQGVRDEPRTLLRRVPELDFIEMPEADRCCGSAGVYNLVQADYALRLLDTKMADIRSIGAEAVVTANPGCMLQLRFGAERERLSLRVYHFAEILEMAAQAGERA